MNTRPASFLYAPLVLLVLLLWPHGVAAQFQARPLEDPATGEKYHIEAAAGFWFPNAYVAFSSAGTRDLAGLIGTTIDAKTDLGLTDQRLPELHLVLRPSKTSKFRLQYIPIKYDQTAIPTRDIVFNGQRYRAQAPVNSTVDWKAYRLGYEFDFVSRNRGYGGFVLDLKYTDLSATLATPLTTPEFSRARNQVCTPAQAAIVSRAVSVSGLRSRHQRHANRGRKTMANGPVSPTRTRMTPSMRRCGLVAGRAMST